MKIVYCIINTWYSGGLTRVLANKANYLASCGNEVTIITTDQLGMPHHYEMSEKITFIDLGVNYVGHDHDSVVKKMLNIPLKLNQHRKKLNKVLQEIKPDITISLFYKDLFFLPFIKDGSMKILEAHSSRYTWTHSREGRGIFSKIQNWLDIFMVKKFDRFVVLTYEDAPDWGSLDNIEVIPNANTFEPQAVSSLDNRTVMAAGRLDYQKNFEGLIDVWKIVQEQCPEWRLNIIGDGIYKEKLQDKIDVLELNNSVCLIPTTLNIQEHYLNSSIYVLTSRYEGLGMVLLEAQSCGVPLVSYACKCGPKDIIEDGVNGFLVNFENKELLADRIIQLIQNEMLRKEMGRNAKLFSKQFSEDIIMHKWLHLFDKLIQTQN